MAAANESTFWARTLLACAAGAVPDASGHRWESLPDAKTLVLCRVRARSSACRVSARSPTGIRTCTGSSQTVRSATTARSPRRPSALLESSWSRGCAAMRGGRAGVVSEPRGREFSSLTAPSVRDQRRDRAHSGPHRPAHRSRRSLPEQRVEAAVCWDRAARDRTATATHVPDEAPARAARGTAAGAGHHEASGCGLMNRAVIFHWRNASTPEG